MKINTTEIKSILGTKQKGFTLGSLFKWGLGEVYIQAYRGKIEGVVCYGVVDGSPNYIDLNSPIGGGINTKVNLVWNKEKKEVEDLYL